MPVGVALAMARRRAQRGAARRRGGGRGGTGGRSRGRDRRGSRRPVRRRLNWRRPRRAFACRLAARTARRRRERRDRLVGSGPVGMSRGRGSRSAIRAGAARPRAGPVRGGPGRKTGPGDGDRIVNRAVVGGRPRDRDRGKVGPTLLGYKGHEPEAHRGGDAQQRKGSAPHPLHQPVAREARPGGEPGQQLSSPGEHLRDHRRQAQLPRGPRRRIPSIDWVIR